MNKDVLIKGASRLSMVPSLLELLQLRSLIPVFAERDIRVRYKQSVLGIGWGLVQPLVLMAILSISLGRVAEVSGGGSSYPVFVLSTLVPWLFFSSGISSGSFVLLADSAIVKRIYFPRELPVLGAVLAALVDFGIGIALFLLLAPFLGAQVSWYWLMVPLLAAPLLMVCIGFSLAFAAMTAYYRDFRHLLPLFLQLLFFASPIVYPISMIPSSWRWLYLANPLASILDNFRHALALGIAPPLSYVALSFLLGFFFLASGYVFFKKLEPNLADVL